MIFALLWTLGFLLPAFTVGAPLPHMPYILIPALAMTVGFTDRSATRRVFLWLGLVLLYELIYHVPVGMLAVPVVAMTVLHIAGAKVIRVEPASATQRTSIASLCRTVIGAFIWIVGLVLLSAVWGTLVYRTGTLSPVSLYTVWWHQGVLGGALVGTLITLAILQIERSRRVQTVFSDHADIQAQHISS